MSADQDRSKIDQDGAGKPGKAGHALPDGAQRHPLIDLDRDPTPGVPNHAKPDDED